MLLSKCRLSNNRLDNFLLSKQTLGNFYLDGPIFGSGLIDHSIPVQVVNANYDTSGNGGRKLVRLNDGTLVCVVVDGTFTKLYKSTNNGATWVLFKTNGWSSITGVALTTDGTYLFLGVCWNGTIFQFTKYDVDGNQVSQIQVDNSQSAMGACSLTIDSFGVLHAAWASKNSTYPNSFNIRYSKSLDGGVTWATPTQITSINTSGQDYANPSIVIGSDDKPHIIVQHDAGTTFFIKSFDFTTVWADHTVYSGSTHIQANPSADIDGAGQINATWQGYGASHTSTYHIFFKHSTDDGATWGTLTDVAVGEKPSITHDKNNNIYIQYERSGVIYQKKSTDHGATWGAETTIATGTNVNTCNNYDNFTQPLNIFDGGADVKFSGVFYS